MPRESLIEKNNRLLKDIQCCIGGLTRAMQGGSGTGGDASASNQLVEIGHLSAIETSTSTNATEQGTTNTNLNRKVQAWSFDLTTSTGDPFTGFPFVFDGCSIEITPNAGVTSLIIPSLEGPTISTLQELCDFINREQTLIHLIVINSTTIGFLDNDLVASDITYFLVDDVAGNSYETNTFVYSNNAYTSNLDYSLERLLFLDAKVNKLTSLTSRETWQYQTGNSLAFTYYSGVVTGNPSGNTNVESIAYMTGVTTVFTQTFTYDANDNVLTLVTT